MRWNRILFNAGLVCLYATLISSQTIEPGNKIHAGVKAVVDHHGAFSFDYAYSVANSEKSKQNIWQFYVVSEVPSHSVISSRSPARWKLAMPEGKHGVEIRWGTPGGNKIRPGYNLSGFRIQARGLPGMVAYYAEGYAPAPAWEESVEEDSIPGYDGLTPYGPGIVGKTIGPVQPPAPSAFAAFVDTLFSYKHRSVALGWLSNDKSRERECERIARGRGWYRNRDIGKSRTWEIDDSWDFDKDWNNGIVGVLDKRLEMAKRALTRGDSVKARRELQIFVMEVELVYNLGDGREARSKKSDFRGKESEIRGQRPVMTSEAYALLKYNAEYLIDRLPAGHGKGRK